jgi:AcrR family transcriptional regulator
MAVTAAKRLVTKLGHAALSTRRVASAIGYAAGSLYRVFRDLDDLILHVNASTLDDLQAALEASARHHPDPEGRMLALAREYIRFAFRHRSLWRLIVERASPQRSPAWFQAKAMRMFEMLQELLREIAPDQPAEELRIAAHALWSGVHGVTVMRLAARPDGSGLERAEKIAESLVSNYLNGFKETAKHRHRSKP